MGFDLTIHWAQVAGTVGAMSAVLGAGGVFATPVMNRRAAAREAGLKAGLREIVVEAVTASDERTKEHIGEVKELVAAVQTQANATDIALATQFGGNGGGIRQELNTLRDSLSTLAGRFEGYLSGKGASSG